MANKASDAFADWMAEVDDYMTRHYGFVSLDLPDAHYWDMWDVGYTVEQAAKHVVSERNLLDW